MIEHLAVWDTNDTDTLENSVTIFCKIKHSLSLCPSSPPLRC